MKKLIVSSATALFFAIASVSPIFAKTATPGGIYRDTVKTARTEFRGEVQNEREDLKTTIKDARKNLGDDIKAKIASGEGMLKKILTGRALLGQVTLTAINGTSLTVSQNGKTISVQTGTFDKCTTQFRRRFWGSSSIAEMSVNDKLNITGIWTDDSKTSVNACLIRNVSIQKRFGVFFGNVIGINSTGLTMSTKSGNRANQTITISTSTSIINRKEQKIGLEDIQVGNLIRVSGMWDNQANTVTEVKTIKDFTLPIVPTPTPTP